MSGPGGQQEAGPHPWSDAPGAQGRGAEGRGAEGRGAEGRGACGAHAGIGADLRGAALHLLERARAVVEPLGEPGAGTPEPGSPGACRACPVCALLAVLRGEHSELAGQLAEHAGGLLAVLRAVLEADGARPGGPGAAGPTGARAPGRRVQRIAVHRR